MTIDHCYWKHNYEYHHARQIEKEALEFHSWKQEKASTSGSAMASQNKTNTFSVVLSTKNSFSKSFTFFALKKQLNTLQVDLSSKLASNSKLTSNECKKCLKNNLCLYCSIGDHKLN